ncbi:MAG: helix-turn-helix domain-containing protein [Firmicutes bacterium]|nr:helix-turn-helix domain-containing protein [Bacillota bacterium]
MKFGDNLKAIRKHHKMSQEQLAEKVNVSRQSVSKWENGEAYPEMHNMLQLCKIFNCKINDLVHTEMSDFSSLDEEIVMNVVKFNEKKQKQVKTLSNVIGLIGKIGGIVLKVAIAFVILAMVLVPYVVSNVDVGSDEITFKTDNIQIIDQDKLEIHDIIIADIDADISQSEFIEIFSTHSSAEIIGYAEAALVFLLINIVIVIIILGYIEKLFNNIKNNNTPFTLDNVNFIKRISYLMIALIILTPLSGIFINLIFGMTEVESPFELMGILEILIIFSMSYIFEYGYEIQKDSKGIIYGEEQVEEASN